MMELLPYTPNRIEEKKQTEKISVIVPVYNVEKYLGRCLDALLSGTYGNLEILVIDDGSTDGSCAIAKEYAAKDARIRLIAKANGGAASARNRGMKEASGDWITFADADDRPDPDMYERLLAAAGDGKLTVIEPGESRETAKGDPAGRTADLVICRARWIYEDTGEITDGGSDRAVILTGEQAMDEFLHEENDRLPLLNAVWNKLYRKELLAGIRFDENRWYEDIMFTTRVLMKEIMNRGRIVYLDHASYNYAVNRKDSYSGNGINPKTLSDQIPIYQERKLYFREKGRGDLADLQDLYFYKRLLDYCEIVHRSGQSAEMKEKTLASLRQVILSEEKDFAAAYSVPGADPSVRKRMERYLRSEKSFFAAADRNENIIVPLKQRIKRLLRK